MADINEKVMNTFEGADFVASNNVELTLVEELVMDVMEANDIAYDDPVVDELFEAFDKLDEDALRMVQKYVNQLDELDTTTLHNYISGSSSDKATRQNNLANHSHKPSEKPNNVLKTGADIRLNGKKIQQRKDGIMKAAVRITKKRGNDNVGVQKPQADAIKSKLKGNYEPKNEDTISSFSSFVKNDKNLQELELKTLHSYNAQANKEIPEIQKSRKQVDKIKSNAKKVDNRLAGSQKAFDKALEKTKAKNAVVKEDVNEELINEALVANPAFKIVKTQLDKDYDNLRDAIKVWKISKYKSMIASLKKGESCYLTTPFRQVYESLDSKAITKETLLEALDDIYNAVLVDQLNEHFEVA